jgi:beta-glucosidase
MRRLRADGIPVVAVFLSGRPMWVNPELNAADAFVAAFLPGSEGGGVADVLFGNADGTVRQDFRGRLSYSWPRRPDQTPLNRGDANYDPLFAYGFGLSYADAGDLAALSEERPEGLATESGVIFVRGALAPGLTFAGQDGVEVRGVDRNAQEDARRVTWSGPGTAAIRSAEPLDISREALGQLSLLFDYRVDAAPDGAVTVGMDCGEGCTASVPVTGTLRAAPVGEWRTMVVPLRCLAQGGVAMDRIMAPLTIASQGRLGLSVAEVRIASAAVDQAQCGQP